MHDFSRFPTTMNNINSGSLRRCVVVIFFKPTYNKTIIRFGFCDILNNQGLGECFKPRPSAWPITLTSTLIISQKNLIQQLFKIYINMKGREKTTTTTWKRHLKGFSPALAKAFRTLSINVKRHVKEDIDKGNPPWIGGRDWTYQQFIILFREFVTFHCLFITLRKSEWYARNIRFDFLIFALSFGIFCTKREWFFYPKSLAP